MCEGEGYVMRRAQGVATEALDLANSCNFSIINLHFYGTHNHAGMCI